MQEVELVSVEVKVYLRKWNQKLFINYPEIKTNKKKNILDLLISENLIKVLPATRSQNIRCCLHAVSKRSREKTVKLSTSSVVASSLSACRLFFSFFCFWNFLLLFLQTWRVLLWIS